MLSMCTVLLSLFLYKILDFGRPEHSVVVASQSRHGRLRQRAAARRLRRLVRFNQIQAAQKLKFLVTILQCASVYMSPDRGVWSHERNQEFFYYTVMRTYTESQWVENFRMSQGTFRLLCDRLRPQLQRQNTIMRQAISVELQVAVAIWVLGSNSEYRVISQLFGIGKSTLCRIVHDFCTAVVRMMKEDYIVFPKGEELRRVVESYKAKWGFPCAAGAIDGTHIPILAPSKNPNDYYNRKGWHSVILQAVVNDRYEITDIYAGWPGRVHDARVFSNSGIFRSGLDGTIFNTMPTVEVEGHPTPTVLLGDPAYPLLPWLMKPFSDNGRLSKEELSFNFFLSRARMTVENTFGRLKGRWRCLLKRLDMNLKNVVHTIMACCILHNLCERERDPFRGQWLEDVQQANERFAQPRVGQVVRQDIPRGDITRAFLVRHFTSHPPNR
ncbi:protein ANTAGONIST OF LIKE HETEROCHROMATIN PROTEIN 1-like [Lingula anatina]|uniref:Protein ANTAGONIST OF LIKE HETEROCHROMATIN PROTEIN 1-like n=1 Tax=Lingula anatina TaxID=7574 RepID=A0A1S3HD67_LINAN|nr:protein ANTAGONIST OF LIKE HETEROCHROMATIN PROTEIN 1-like [Lingula anatina]|eukprot:XP_013383945.1 protein ANTAGONIST OF LIKE HETEROCHROMATIN PROTEIN 1-like [Lingula anatina]